MSLNWEDSCATAGGIVPSNADCDNDCSRDDVEYQHLHSVREGATGNSNDRDVL